MKREKMRGRWHDAGPYWVADDKLGAVISEEKLAGLMVGDSFTFRDRERTTVRALAARYAARQSKQGHKWHFVIERVPVSDSYLYRFVRTA